MTAVTAAEQQQQQQYKRMVCFSGSAVPLPVTTVYLLCDVTYITRVLLADIWLLNI